MPLRGGRSGKLGDHYEAIWTVKQLLEVLAGKLSKIVVEPFGEEGIGVEFWVEWANGTREYHSAKRQTSKAGGWTLYELTKKDPNGRSILGDLKDKVEKQNLVIGVFVSGSGAGELRELIERADGKESLAAFLAEVDSSQQLRKNFEKYLVGLCGDDESAFQFLCRLKVVLIDEESLKQSVDQRITDLIYNTGDDDLDPPALRSLLANEFLLKRFNQVIEAKECWNWLDERGFGYRDWARDHLTQRAVREANEQFIRNAERELVARKRLPRAEADSIRGHLVAAEKKHVLVTSPAGFGKSCALVQVLGQLTTDGIPVLAIRLDRYPNANSPKEIGRHLNLRESPAVALAGIANGRQCVLIVDQLDAVSRLSGRHLQLWDVFDALRHEVARYPNMRLLLACRPFDLEHDHRLRSLRSERNAFEPVTLGVLSQDDVIAVLNTEGVDTKLLGRQQIELLQIPLHLYLYLEGLDGSAVSFAGINDLFDRFWERKHRRVSELVGSSESHWLDVIDGVCDELTDKQSLLGDWSSLEKWNLWAETMASEHVLVRDGPQVHFFHETFFDYAFARRFCHRGRELIGLLTSSEQHLFRRAQVRQVLKYLRDRNDPSYATTLSALLNDDRVRFHIKRLVFAWVGALIDPGDQEWNVLEPLTADLTYRDHALLPMRNHVGWFDLLDRRGLFQQWLRSEDELLANTALWFFSSPELRKHRSAAIAKLLEPFVGRGDVWHMRFIHLFRFGDAHQSSEMQSLFLGLLRTGLFFESETDRQSGWWGTIRDSAETAPEFALSAVCCWLDHLIERLRAEEQTDENIRFERHQAAEHVILGMAQRAPAKFAIQVFPRIVEMIQQASSEQFLGVAADLYHAVRSNREPIGSGDAIVEGVLIGLRYLAHHDADQLDRLLSSHRNTRLAAVAHLLVEAWIANPPKYANQIVDFLAGDNRRLDLGYIFLSEGNGDAALSRKAVRDVVPHLAEKDRLRLEATILGFKKDWGSPSDEYNEYIKVLLLDAFGESYLSERARTHLRALRQADPEVDFSFPGRARSVLSRVVSPISAEAAANFSDDEWLDAMKAHPNEWSGSGIEGGAVELGRVLEKQIALDRLRFAHLALKTDDAVNEIYFSAILDGLCDPRNLSAEEKVRDQEDFKRIPTETYLRVIRRVHRLPTEGCGRSVCNAFERLAERNDIPIEDLKLLERYAMEASDPAANATYSASVDREMDLHFHGYNSVRGMAARAISALLFADYSRSSVLLPILEAMVKDPSLAVRTCVIEGLLPLLNHDRALAVKLLIEICADADALIGCETFEQFVSYATWTHYTELRPLLNRGLTVSSGKRLEAIGRLICLAAFDNQQAETDATSVRGGSEQLRVGAAAVYAHNIDNGTVGRICEVHLRNLFNDESEEVRREASVCFSRLDDAGFEQYSDLVRAYIDSRSFPSPHDHLLRRLEESTWRLPDVIERLVARFVEVCGKQAGDISTAASGDAPTVAKLLVRLYSQTLDEAVKIRCLNLIDDMERLRFYGIDRELSEFER